MGIGISERNCLVKAFDSFETNRNVFLKFWTEYQSNRNCNTIGYLTSPCERNLLMANELKYSERNISIPSITVISERNIIQIPICFNERNCIYKRYYVENDDKQCYLIPICFNEKYITITFLKQFENDVKCIANKIFVTETKLLTQLPPLLTKYDFRKIFYYLLPPNTDERKICYDKYHIKYTIPREFDKLFVEYYDTTDSTSFDTTSTYNIEFEHIKQEYYDGNNFIFNINSDYEKVLDGTITNDYFETLEIGLNEGFDYGELFLIDLKNDNVFNLSLDALYKIDIYGAFTKDLYLISNQNNLYIKVLCNFTHIAKKDFKDIYYNSNENKEKFRNDLTKYFINYGYFRLKINNEQITNYFKLFHVFPRRFLIPFEIYINENYQKYINMVELIYYFPYRFKNTSKRYSILLLTNYI